MGKDTKARRLDTRRDQKESLVIGPRERLAIRAPNPMPLPLANAHRPRVIGKQEVERRRHHHLVAPTAARDPTILLQVVGSGSNYVRDRIDDVAASITVKVDGIFFERGGHELRRAK